MPLDERSFEPCAWWGEDHADAADMALPPEDCLAPTLERCPRCRLPICAEHMERHRNWCEDR